MLQPMPIIDIVDAVANPRSAWRTLRGVKPVCHNSHPIYVTGNAAVVFTIKHEGREKRLKCYTRTNPHLAAIYGKKFLPRELCITTFTGEKMWIDCLLCENIEGGTLDEVIGSTSCCEEFATLAKNFDLMACKLLGGDMAHGDLKPENIIVGSDGQMHLIDFDSAYIDSMAGEQSPEIGTAAYQHPTRDTDFFDRHLDDYSIAMLSTTLHAAALDRRIAESWRQTHEPPFSPREIVERKSALFDEVVELFARRGLAREYRIARMLYSLSPRLFNLESTLRFSLPTSLTTTTRSATLEQEGGLWGCRGDEGWIVPPLYDDGFEPSNDGMVVVLGGYTHLISLRSGLIVRSFDKGVVVRPIDNRRIAISNPDTRQEVLEWESLLQNSTK